MYRWLNGAEQWLVPQNTGQIITLVPQNYNKDKYEHMTSAANMKSIQSGSNDHKCS